MTVNFQKIPFVPASECHITNSSNNIILDSHQGYAHDEIRSSSAIPPLRVKQNVDCWFLSVWHLEEEQPLSAPKKRKSTSAFLPYQGYYKESRPRIHRFQEEEHEEWPSIERTLSFDDWGDDPSVKAPTARRIEAQHSPRVFNFDNYTKPLNDNYCTPTSALQREDLEYGVFQSPSRKHEIPTPEQQIMEDDLLYFHQSLPSSGDADDTGRENPFHRNFSEPERSFDERRKCRQDFSRSLSVETSEITLGTNLSCNYVHEGPVQAVEAALRPECPGIPRVSPTFDFEDDIQDEAFIPVNVTHHLDLMSTPRQNDNVAGMTGSSASHENHDGSVVPAIPHEIYIIH